jgi:hypothetical protein
MPDTDLDQDLARARAALLDRIDQPPLAQIASRAAVLRRRRRAVRGGTALAAVLAIGIGLLRPWSGGPEATLPPAETPSSGPVYAADGITINGLTKPVPEIPDLPGAIADVEFADADHGYLITTLRVFASTEDGGLTWQRHDVPADVRTTQLYLFPGGEIGLPDGYVSADGGKTWQRQAGNNAQPVTAAGKDELLLDSGGGTLAVMSPGYGFRGYLANAPPITVSWVAARPTADGIWWVAGTTNDGTNKPALASSRDGGRTWQPVVLDAPPGQPQVSFLGSHVYAVVVGADRRVLAILHSTDGGQHFTPVRTGGDAQLRTLAGDLVPLLDGRLLAATTSHEWYLSSDGGATFRRATGTLPVVGALRRTWAGYVAYDLFGGEPAGWAAFSSDGSTWRKLQVH